MIAKLLRYFARRTHNIQLQLLLATLFGLVSIYGVGGGFAILLKARKLASKRKATPRAHV